MEFILPKGDLVRELQTVTGVVEKRATLPILANLLLEAKGDRLLVGASDLEVTVRGSVAATVLKEGSVTLPAGKLHEIARSLPDSEVQFKLLERNQVSIVCERTRYRIAGQPRDDFPSFPSVDESGGVRLPGKVLHGLIERVAFAITMEDPRYSLNGALFLLESDKITLVATDGHRLAFAANVLEGKSGPKEAVKVIVPRKALGEVAKLTAEVESDEEVVFGTSDGQVYFVVGQHRLTSTVLEGNFPSYTNVMPESCGTTVIVPTDDFAQAVRRVSLLASDRYGRAVRVGLSSGKLDLSSKTEMGEAQESLPVDYDGDELEIGFNARYLQDFFQVVGSPTVRLELDPIRPGDDAGSKGTQASDKPGQLRPDQEGPLDYRYVVMPMHL
jgi:DNA polymerase-3 subunit beta